MTFKRADCSLQAAHVGTVFAPEAGLEGLGPALHALQVHVAVEEAARERDGVVARLQLDLKFYKYHIIYSFIYLF